jgi:hypothetical protein
MEKNQKAFGGMVNIRQILIGLPVRLFGYLLYLIFPPPDQVNIPHKSSIRTSIFVAFIFFISIFYFNINYLNFPYNIYNNDCIVCDTGDDSIDDVSNLSIYDVYQAHSNDLIIVIVPTKNVSIKPYDLKFKIFTRAPPA